MSFEELIGGLGKAIGMELTVQDGLCGVKADGVPVVMRYIEPYAIVYIHADLGVPPPEGLEAVYRKLLESNHAFQGTSGATLSVNPRDGHVCLQHYIRLEVLDVALAVERFNVFVDAVKAWRDYLADFRPMEESKIDIRSMLSGFLV